MLALVYLGFSVYPGIFHREHFTFYQLSSAPFWWKITWSGLLNGDGSRKNPDNFWFIENFAELKDGLSSNMNKRNKTCEASQVIGVKDDCLMILVRVICIVMQLGNMTFVPSPGGNIYSSVINSPRSWYIQNSVSCGRRTQELPFPCNRVIWNDILLSDTTNEWMDKGSRNIITNFNNRHVQPFGFEESRRLDNALK